MAAGGGGGGLWRVEDEEVEGGEYHGEGGLRFHFGCRYDELMIGGCCFVGATEQISIRLLKYFFNWLTAND